MLEIPTLETAITSKIHLIGGEKGGVGKSMVARLLAQYLIDNNLQFTGFDTDRSHSSLMRFYAGYVSPVLMDRYEALDAIVETAAEQSGRRVLVDLAAQTHAPLVRWMDESGVLDLADVSGIVVHYWHVMDAGKDSVDLLKRLLDRFGRRVRYVLVRNQLRGDDFGQLERSGEQERAYLAVREKEGRIYSDRELARLPEVEPNHPHYREWRIRASSLNRLLRYLKGKEKPDF